AGHAPAEPAPGPRAPWAAPPGPRTRAPSGPGPPPPPLPAPAAKAMPLLHHVTFVLGARYTAPARAITAAPAAVPVSTAPTVAASRTATAHHESAGRAATSGHTPLCLPCEPSNFFGVIGGAREPGPAGAVAALTRFQLFAPSGAGRVRHDASALGSPVDIAPDERPG